MLEYVIKAAAAVLMVSSGYFFGKSFEKKLKDRHEILLMLSEAVYYLQSKICSEGCTLPEALKATDRKYCEYKNSVFCKAAEYMNAEALEGEPAWVKACETCNEKPLLNCTDMETLKGAGKLLGCGDSQMQKDNLSSLTDQLKAAAAAAGNKCKKDGALYIKLGLAVGSIIAVIMW